jgi:hypothetical protein
MDTDIDKSTRGFGNNTFIYAFQQERIRTTETVITYAMDDTTEAATTKYLVGAK